MNGKVPTRTEAVWAIAGSIAFAIFFGFPILRHLTSADPPYYLLSDWDFSMELHWVAYYTITHFHQFPLWDPYKCGGMPALGNPQSAAVTPFILLELIFGPMIGLRLSIIAHIALGFGGAYLLARLMGISPIGAVACAVAFAGSSWFYLHIEVGHICFLPGAYLPWPPALLYMSVEERKMTPAAIAGLFMALMMTEGGAHPLVWAGLIMALLAPLLAIEYGSIIPLEALVVAAVFTVGFGAVKLLPGLDFTGVHARVESPFEFHSPRFFPKELFLHDQNPNLGTPGLQWGFYEYGAYIGIVVAILAIAGMLFQFRRAWPWIIIAAVMLGMAVGYFGTYSPWFLIHKVPFYASLREPERWLAPFTLATGVLAGFGAEAIGQIDVAWAPFIAICIVALVLCDDWIVSTRYLHYIVEGPDAYAVTATDVLRPPPRSFRQSDIPDLGAHMYLAAKADVGTLRCYDVPGLVPPVYPLGYQQVGYQGEQHLLGAGTVKLTRWTPNALTFDVDAPTTTAVIVNQNYSHNWSIMKGHGMVMSNDGLLAVLIPSGRQTIEITYRGTSFWQGLAITLATSVTFIILWLWERRRAEGAVDVPALG